MNLINITPTGMLRGLSYKYIGLKLTFEMNHHLLLRFISVSQGMGNHVLPYDHV